MTPDNIPWYKSNVLRGIAVSLIAGILARFHITAQFAPNAGAIVDTGLDLITLGSAAFAAYSRVKHPLPAITSTQAKADIANGVSANAKVTDSSPPPAP